VNEAERELEVLGEHVRAELGEPLDDARRLRQRVRLVESAQRAPRRRWAWSIALATVGAAALAFVVLPRPTLEVRGVEVGRWTEDARTAWRFSDGSEVQLEPNGRARLEHLRAGEVRVVLAEGALVSEVEPSTGARWTFEAGPYVVTVLGTRLGVRWSSDTGRLEVPVWRGRVAVEGGALRGRRFEVGAGERLVVRGNEVSLGPVDETEPREPPEETESEASDANRDPTDAPSHEARTPSERRPRVDALARFRELARAGHHREALDAVPDRARLLARGSAEDLLLLGDAARLSGDEALAERAFVAVRTRFSGSGDAGAATFRLARLGSSSGRPADAARWYETYAREHPGGPLASQARGRAIEAWQRAGDRAQARAAAQTYLARHPDGPYRALASEVIGAP
jgi:TolA-binding protein